LLSREVDDLRHRLLGGQLASEKVKNQTLELRRARARLVDIERIVVPPFFPESRLPLDEIIAAQFGLVDLDCGDYAIQNHA
jgi:hypothetical protein